LDHDGRGAPCSAPPHVFKPCRGAVVAVRDYHLVLDQECAHLASLAIGIFGPYKGHAEVAPVEYVLVIVAGIHTRQS